MTTPGMENTTALNQTLRHLAEQYAATAEYPRGSPVEPAPAFQPFPGRVRAAVARISPDVGEGG